MEKLTAMAMLRERKQEMYIQLNECEELEKELSKDVMGNVDKLIKVNEIKKTIVYCIIHINERMQDLLINY